MHFSINYFHIRQRSADTSLTSTTTRTQTSVTFALMQGKVYDSLFPLVVRVSVDRGAREMSNTAHPVLKGWHLRQEPNSADGG